MSHKGLNGMHFEVIEDLRQPGQWRVEAIHEKSEGECYVALFVGHEAEKKAKEYATWKNEQIAYS